MDDDFDYDIEYDIDDDQPDSFMLDNVDNQYAPDGTELNDKVRMEVIQGVDGPEHHLYFGLRKTYEANYKVGQLEYDVPNLWGAFQDFKNGDRLAAMKKFDQFWNKPLTFPDIKSQGTVEFTHKELEKSALLSGIVPIDDIVLVNPPPGTLKRLHDSHADIMPVVCTNQEKDQNYKDVKAMKLEINYSASIEMDPHYHRKNKEGISFLGFVGTEILTEGKIMGFETNPCYATLMDDYYTHVEEESDGYVLTFLRKGKRHKYKWLFNTDYKRVSPYVYYEIMKSDTKYGGYITENFNDRMKSNTFIYRDVPELDQLFWEKGQGKIISQDVFINGCDSIFYDVIRIGDYEDRFTGHVYKVVYAKDGPVDIACTPYIYVTRRSILMTLFPELGKVFKNVTGMVNPHRADNISNDIVNIKLIQGEYYVREKLKIGTIVPYYYTRPTKPVELRYYIRNLHYTHFLYEHRNKKYDNAKEIKQLKEENVLAADVTSWYLEFTTKYDVIYYQDTSQDNMIGAGNCAPMIRVPLPKVGHYYGPRSKKYSLVSTENKICITDSVSVLDAYQSHKKGRRADSYFYGTLYSKTQVEDEVVVEGITDLEYSPILLESYSYDNT